MLQDAKARFSELVRRVRSEWRLLVEEGRKTSHTFSQPDLIIAATALCHGLTILSRDTSDFERARTPVVDPWK